MTTNTNLFSEHMSNFEQIEFNIRRIARVFLDLSNEEKWCRPLISGLYGLCT